MRIAVKKLPKDNRPAGWNAILPKAAPATPLLEDKTADWLVIGAGFAGLAAARRLTLARPEDSVVILDATRIGEGPAGRNSGFMIDLPHDLSSTNYAGGLEADQATIADNRMAIAFAWDAAKAYGLPDAAFTQSGKINAAASKRGDQHNRDYAKHLDRLGEPHEWLDHAAMKALTGSDYYISGLRTPSAAMIQPALYVRGVGAGLASNRVTIHEQSPVTALEREGDWIATTPLGKVRAPKVILAVNGHLASFGFYARDLMHIFTYASMTRAMTPDEVSRLGGAPSWDATPADPLGTSVRRISGQGGHRLLVRNRFTYDPHMEIDQRRISRVGKDHDKAFRARWPMLKDVEMEHRWGGRLCLSRNNVQVIRELEPGLFAAACQNGLGTVRGTLAGMLAADLALGHTSAALERALASDQPQRLPPSPLTKFGAAMRLTWGEFRAGRDF